MDKVLRGVLSRPPFAAALGLLAITLGTVAYSLEQRSMLFVTPVMASYFSWIAMIYLLVLLVGVLSVAFDVSRVVRDRIGRVRSQGFAPLSPTWVIPHVLSIRRYRLYFLASTMVYAVFYAVITSMIVYQPTVDFAGAYGATIPSVVITPCCGPPLFIPVVTVYLMNHLGLLLIPLTGILLIVISVLVGVNFSLAAFAYGNRARIPGKGWVGGIGALVGLFTGCPTCAGLFFANVIGGTGAVSLATVLAGYQPLFLLLSLPVLVVTPYLISRSLAKVFKEGCVFLRPMALS